MTSSSTYSNIYLDTVDGDRDNNYNTIWSISNPRLNLLDGFSISLHSVMFPNTVYPTNEYNNILEVTENGVDAWSIVLTPNVYTGSSIATALQSSLNDADISNPLTGVYTVTYDSTSKKLSFSSTVAFTFVLVSNNCYENLGLDTSTFSSFSTSWVSSFPVHLEGTKYVDVITNISNMSYSSRVSGHTLCRVPVTVGFGNIVFYSNNYQEHLQTSTLHLDEISIQLKDDRGNFYKLPKNSHLSLVFTLNIPDDNFDSLYT